MSYACFNQQAQPQIKTNFLLALCQNCAKKVALNPHIIASFTVPELCSTSLRRKIHGIQSLFSGFCYGHCDSCQSGDNFLPNDRSH